MPKSERITSVNFTQFKAFARYALSLEHMNILVGPNNSGKSTIIGAVRALAAALRVARSRNRRARRRIPSSRFALFPVASQCGASTPPREDLSIQ